MKDILNNYDSMTNVIIDELEGYKKAYARERRTVIENGKEAIYEENKVEEQDVILLLDRFGYAKTVDVATYERNKEAADSENKHIVPCKNTGKVCIFTNTGKMHQVKVSDIPYGKFRDKSVPIDNLGNYDSAQEEIVYLCAEEELKDAKLLFVTRQSMLKQVAGEEFLVSKRTTAATKLQEADEVVAVIKVLEEQNIVLQTEGGYFLRFLLSEVPEKKKGAVGVRGMKLQKSDRIEQIYLFADGVDTKGSYQEKEVSLNRLKLNKRDGKGRRHDYKAKAAKSACFSQRVVLCSLID